MAKIKFKKNKDAEHFELNAVQDVKVNGISVFDGEEANIELDEYTIAVPNMSDKIKINTNDLAYIKENKPRTLKINFGGTSNLVNLNLNITNSSVIKYSNVMNAGQYSLFSYFLQIKPSDTEQTGCDFMCVGYTVSPDIPIYAQNKTYMLELINEIPTWIEDDFNNYQPLINNSHKLSADLVDDESTTNKFVTSEEKTTWSGKQDELVSGTNIKTINNTSILGSGDISISAGSMPKKKTLTNSSSNYSVSNNVVTVTDADVTSSNHVELYPADATTETWLENNLSSCIITQSTGSFSFNISSSLPATFSMYYIITEVQ